MKPFGDRMQEDQRLVLLRLLRRQNAYRANSSVLTDALYHLGHAVSRDGVKTHLHWLAEQALLTVEEPVDGILVATLTERGVDVAAGHAVVPGVKRPGA